MRTRLVFTSGSAHDIKGLGAALERLEGGRDILRSPDFECGDVEAERAGRCLNLAHLQHGDGIADIGHDRQTAQTGDNLAQEFEPLAGKIGRLDRQAGDVAARSRQARDEAGADRVPRHREHDRDDRCRLLCRDDVAVPDVTMTSTLSRTNSAAISAKRSLRPSAQRYSIATVRPSIQPSSRSRCTKAASPWASGRSRGSRPRTRWSAASRLLRACRQRPRGRRAAEQRDELAPPCMSGKEHCEG